MDYENPSQKPKTASKKASPSDFPAAGGIKTRRGKVVYRRKRPHYLSWIDIDRIFFSAEPPASAGAGAAGAALALRGSDELKKVYAILDLFIITSGWVSTFELGNPVYLDGFLRTDPNTGWRGSRERAMRDRVRLYLQDEEIKLIINTAKQYFQVFSKLGFIKTK